MQRGAVGRCCGSRDVQGCMLCSVSRTICAVLSHLEGILAQVCKRWHAVAARNLQTLRPAVLKMHVFVRVFPSLTVLDLSGALSMP